MSTVLYVEDNPANLKLVERIFLRRPKIQLTTAITGRIGVDLATQLVPELLLLDMNLPDMNGDEILAVIRGNQVTASIPIVVVSADASETQVERMLAAGATAYLTKPFDVREFLDLIDRLLMKGLPNAAIT